MKKTETIWCELHLHFFPSRNYGETRKNFFSRVNFILCSQYTQINKNQKLMQAFNWIISQFFFLMLKQILLTLAGLWSANGLTAAKYEQLSGLDNAPKLSFDGMWFIGKVVSVYDGDTCQVVFNVDGDFVKFPVRVTGIDTPERKGTLKEFGTEVGVKTREMIDDKIVYLKAGAFEKYGRLLGSVYACLPEGDTVNISELLIAEKMAKPYDGGTKNTFTQEDYDAYKQHIQNVILPTFVDCPNQHPS